MLGVYVAHMGFIALIASCVDRVRACCGGDPERRIAGGGHRRFPGEYRFPDAATIVRVQSHVELADRCRFETRYYISSAMLSAEQARRADSMGRTCLKRCSDKAHQLSIGSDRSARPG
jgi:hypothetical protein